MCYKAIFNFKHFQDHHPVISLPICSSCLQLDLPVVPHISVFSENPPKGTRPSPKFRGNTDLGRHNTSAMESCLWTEQNLRSQGGEWRTFFKRVSYFCQEPAPLSPDLIYSVAPMLLGMRGHLLSHFSWFGGVPTTPDPNTSAKHRDTNGTRIMIPIGGVPHTFAKVLREKWEVYRDIFKRIGVTSRFNSPEWLSPCCIPSSRPSLSTVHVEVQGELYVMHAHEGLIVSQTLAPPIAKYM